MTKGFTLLEVLIVMAVIGILAALGISQFDTETPRVREDQTALAQLFERSRTIARRFSANVYLEKLDDKTVKAESRGLDGKIYWTQTIKFQYAKFTTNTEQTPIVFEGPFGRLRVDAGQGAKHIEFETLHRHAEIDLIGVTGLVTSRAIKRI
jgi:prepilin-type N-terminal cleavage/methylation domain-containing protein